MKDLKQELFNKMEEIDYMDQDLSSDVEEVVESEFVGMFAKKYAKDYKRIREIWFEFCYEENKDRYLKQFNLI